MFLGRLDKLNVVERVYDLEDRVIVMWTIMLLQRRTTIMIGRIQAQKQAHVWKCCGTGSKSFMFWARHEAMSRVRCAEGFHSLNLAFMKGRRRLTDQESFSAPHRFASALRPLSLRPG